MTDQPQQPPPGWQRQQPPPPGWQPPQPPPGWQPQQQPPDWNLGRDAGRSFISGFTGCLGVGFAVIVVLIVLFVLILHH